MWLPIFAAVSAGGAECPEGWADRGCAAGTVVRDGCCPTATWCAEQASAERQLAARQILGSKYDERATELDRAWLEVEGAARACLNDLDLPLCPDAQSKLRRYLDQPRTFSLHVSGGSQTIETACGPQRLLFDGGAIDFDVPHLTTAQTLYDAVVQLRAGVVAQPERTLGSAGIRPPGAPKTGGYTRPAGAPVPAGVDYSSDTTGLSFDQLYVEAGDTGPVISTLRMHKGRFAACYQSLHPGWREAPGQLTMSWVVGQGRAAKIAFPHDSVGSEQLRTCLQGVLADLPFTTARDGRSSLVFRVTAP